MRMGPGLRDGHHEAAGITITYVAASERNIGKNALFCTAQTGIKLVAIQHADHGDQI